MPILVRVISHAGASLFLPRYMLPAVLAWAVVLAHIAAVGGAPTQSAAAVGGRLPARAAAAGSVGQCAILLLFPIRWARQHEPLWGRGSGASRRALVAERVREIGGVPIITESMHDFMPLAYYAPPGATPYFALDRDAARLSDPLQQVLMRRYGEHGYFASRIVLGDAFVCAHERFAVADAQGSHWYDQRLRDNPAFESQVVDSAFRRQQDGRLVRLILVRRRAGASDGACPAR